MFKEPKPQIKKSEKEDPLKLYSVGYAKIGFQEGDSFRSIEGDVYSIGESRYLVTKKDNVYLMDDKTAEKPRITDENIISQVLKLKQKNENATKRRLEYVQRLAQGDEILEEILLMNLYYNNGSIKDVVIKNGIRFYRVGRNSSHCFYAGTKDGIKYVYSYAPDGEGGRDFENVVDVDTWGYLGHF